MLENDTVGFGSSERAMASALKTPQLLQTPPHRHYKLTGSTATVSARQQQMQFNRGPVPLISPLEARHHSRACMRSTD